MITTARPPTAALSARSLARVFSNHTRCDSCHRASAIRVHYCPGCPAVSGSHFHRLCHCGAQWLERSAGHAPLDLNLDSPAFVLICQHCRTRVPTEKAQNPRCCPTPEVSYHDLDDPCELCRNAGRGSPKSAAITAIRRGGDDQDHPGGRRTSGAS